MKSLLKKITDLILYGNFWIAIGATSMAFQTQYLLVHHLRLTPLTGFIFSATLFLYALHRIVGLEKTKAFQQKGRYKIIATFSSHILIYAILGGLASFILFWYLPAPLKWLIVGIGLISIAYVLPFIGAKRRLRDLSYIKVFAIAIVWPLVSVLLPAYEFGMQASLLVALLMLEKFCFLMAITLPFDIRDIEVDLFNNVKTIPNQIGAQRSVYLAEMFLFMATFIFSIGYSISLISWGSLIGYLFANMVAAFLIWYAPRNKHDYYFTGLLDGTMVLQGWWVVLGGFNI